MAQPKTRITDPTGIFKGYLRFIEGVLDDAPPRGEQVKAGRVLALDVATNTWGTLSTGTEGHYVPRGIAFHDAETTANGGKARITIVVQGDVDEDKIVLFEEGNENITLDSVITGDPSKGYEDSYRTELRKMGIYAQKYIASDVRADASGGTIPDNQ